MKLSNASALFIVIALVALIAWICWKASSKI